MIRVARAPAYATVQDAGRAGFLSSGVPRSGAMDIACLQTINAMLGNEPHAAAIEWALSGGELVFDSSGTFAIGGARAAATIEGHTVEPWQAHRYASGETLSISAPEAGRFLYVAVAGGLDTPLVLGSRSTYVNGEFGGVEGRRLKSGDLLGTGGAPSRRKHQVSDPLPESLRPPFGNEVVRFVPRGETDLERAWKISSASDRTGYRIESDMPAIGASITSEPVCPGTIQIPPGGQPIVLMADAPTIGGYLIAGAVISADLGALAQRIPGSEIRLEATTVEHAQRELERIAERIASVREWALG